MKILAHLDLDAFFAAVEELENPSLRDKPLVVGGDPHGRGVVSTANYAARKFGIHSAMSAAEALRRCPHAVFLPPSRGLYSQYSRAVWTVVREGVGAAIAFIEQQIEAGAFDGGIARCKATTRKGKACQRTPLPNRDYCPSHQHLEARTSLAA